MRIRHCLIILLLVESIATKQNRFGNISLGRTPHFLAGEVSPFSFSAPFLNMTIDRFSPPKGYHHIQNVLLTVLSTC